MVYYRAKKRLLVLYFSFNLSSQLVYRVKSTSRD